MNIGTAEQRPLALAEQRLFPDVGMLKAGEMGRWDGKGGRKGLLGR